MGGKEVRVAFEEYDRYGRVVEKVLVRAGRPIVPLATSGDQRRYEFEEQETKTKKVVLWQDKNPIPPQGIPIV